MKQTCWYIALTLDTCLSLLQSWWGLHFGLHRRRVSTFQTIPKGFGGFSCWFPSPCKGSCGVFGGAIMLQLGLCFAPFKFCLWWRFLLWSRLCFCLSFRLRGWLSCFCSAFCSCLRPYWWVMLRCYCCIIITDFLIIILLLLFLTLTRYLSLLYLRFPTFRFCLGFWFWCAWFLQCLSCWWFFRNLGCWLFENLFLCFCFLFGKGLFVTMNWHLAGALPNSQKWK